MDINRVFQFFQWCTIVNGVLLLFTTFVVMLMPNRIYRLHSRCFSLSRDSFNVIVYAYLGLFKLFFIFFNLIPYLVLILMT